MTKRLFIKTILSAVVIFAFITGIILFRGISVYAEHVSDDGIVAMSKEEGDSKKYAIDVKNIDPLQMQSVKYIKNSNYFILNPDHADPDEDKNDKGTCTTVAMQIMLGYHNYYSDRRLIPQDDGYGNAFLYDTYADPSDDPCFHELEIDSMFPSLGTKHEVYNKIYEFTLFSDVSGIGQAIPLVCDGTKKFINTYSDPEIRKNVSISDGSYIETDVIAEIDADRPVVLVFSPFAAGVNDKTYHVVVAYGYATVNNQFGYIVHYGMQNSLNHAWVPADCFGFMATMKVSHTHNYVDTGVNVKDDNRDYRGRELKCDICGGNTVDDLYNVEEVVDNDNDTLDIRYKITKVKYPLYNSIYLPRKIRGKEVVEIGNGAFKETTMSGITFGDITKIGNGAFENCLNLTTVDIMFVDNIGDNAFSGCSNLRDIYISDRLTDIGKGAYRGCYNATIYVNENNPKFATEQGSNILYDKDKTDIIHAGKVDRNLEIHSTVTYIEDYAFSDNIYLESIRFKSNPKIGCGAFSDCKNLKWIYYEQSVPPEVGEGALTNVDVSINVPYKAQSAFKTAFSPYPESNITSVEFLVIFIDGESILHTEQAYYGSDIDEFYMPVKIGYNFDGWYDDPEFVGERYLNGGEWKTESDVIYYSKWIPNTYTVTLDPDGGVLNGENSVTAEYGRLLPNPPTVTRQGYELEGWYDQNNKKYITAEGQGIAPWDKTVNTTLKALWRPYEYTIKIMSDKIALTESGKEIWLVSNGISIDKDTVEYDSEITVGEIKKAVDKALYDYFSVYPLFNDTGKIYTHCLWNSNEVDWMRIPLLGENGTEITIEPQWINEQYMIKFDTGVNGLAVNPMTVTYGNAISLPNMQRAGYTFKGWYFGNVLQNWNKVDDLTKGEQNKLGEAPPEVMFIAKWEAFRFTVTYKANKGSGNMAVSSHLYGDTSKLKKNTFTRTGYNFIGWSELSSGGVKYYNESKASDAYYATVNNIYDGANKTNIDLYAVWEPIRYTINFGNLADGMKAYPNYYYYDEGLPVLPKLYYKGSSGGRDTEVETYAWYDNIGFTVTAKTFKPQTKTGSITMYAKYEYFLLAIYDNGLTYKVTDAGINNNPHIDVDVYLDSVYYAKVKNTTLKKIKFELSFNLWEVDDGYQHIYLFNNVDPLCKWNKKIDHTGGKKSYKYTIELDLESNYYTDIFRFRFDASGWGSDTWKFNEFNLKVILTD